MKLFQCDYYTPEDEPDQILVVAEDDNEAEREVAAVYHAVHGKKPTVPFEEYVSGLTEVRLLADRRGRWFTVEIKSCD